MSGCGKGNSKNTCETREEDGEALRECPHAVEVGAPIGSHIGDGKPRRRVPRFMTTLGRRGQGTREKYGRVRAAHRRHVAHVAHVNSSCPLVTHAAITPDPIEDAEPIEEA